MYRSICSQMATDHNTHTQTQTHNDDDDDDHNDDSDHRHDYPTMPTPPCITAESHHATRDEVLGARLARTLARRRRRLPPPVVRHRSLSVVQCRMGALPVSTRLGARATTSMLCVTFLPSAEFDVVLWSLLP